MICAFTVVVLPAGASLGTASGVGHDTGWARRLDVNWSDPVELTLAADLQRSVLAHVVTSSCNKYRVAGGVYRPECGDEKVRPQRQEPKGAL